MRLVRSLHDKHGRETAGGRPEVGGLSLIDPRRGHKSGAGVGVAPDIQLQRFTAPSIVMRRSLGAASAWAVFDVSHLLQTLRVILSPR